MLRMLTLCLVFGLLGSPWAYAQETPAPDPQSSETQEAAPEERPAINTNRPTQGTNTGVVGPGTVQLEIGVNNVSFKGGGDSLTQAVGQLRVGLGKTTEFSLFNPVFNSLGGNSGVGDTTVQLKWQFAEIPVENGKAVFALVPNVSLRTGSSSFQNPGTVAQLLFSSDIPLGSQGQTLTLNLAGTSLEDASTDERFGQMFTAAYYTFPVASGVNVWLEVSGIGPDASSGGLFIPAVDTGMQFLVDNDTAIDFDILKGLGPRGTDWAVTVGFGHRF